MDLNHLFTSFDGRINRRPFWMGILLLIAFAIVVMIVLGSIVGRQSRVFAVIVLLLQLALLYPWLALSVKRLHDRGRPDYFAYIIIAPGLLNGVTNALGITGDQLNISLLEYLLGLIILIVGIWALIELGFLRGLVGPNAYGPDPLEVRRS